MNAPIHIRLFFSVGLTLAMVCAASVAGLAAEKPSLDRAAIEKYVRHLYMWGPQIQVAIGDPAPSGVQGLLSIAVTASAGEGSQTETFYLTADGGKLIRGQMMDLDRNPFHDENQKLKNSSKPSRGTPGAPVVVTMFGDFQCPACAEEAKSLKKNLLAAYPAEVRLYYRDFPLPIHPWAKRASQGGYCLFSGEGNEAFWAYHDWVFANQPVLSAENFDERLNEYLKEKGTDPGAVGACMNSPAAGQAVERSIAEARELGIQSTPTLFVNGRRIRGIVDWATLKQIIDFEIEYQKVAKNAGDDCGCEVTLPSPFK